MVQISIPKKKAKSKKKKNAAEATITPPNDATSKKVRFDMSKNKVTEFFKHGKVA
jgi:hypothetical protein